jgi:hypothetical protein
VNKLNALWDTTVFFFLLTLGLPVALSLGSTMLVLVVTKSSLPLMIVPQQMIIGADNFTLIAIPFFISSVTSIQRGSSFILTAGRTRSLGVEVELQPRERLRVSIEELESSLGNWICQLIPYLTLKHLVS